MTDDSLNNTQQNSVGIINNERLLQSMSVEQISKFVSSSICGREIWNAAIEAENNT